MASPIVMPSFGMYTADGTLVSWLHPPGAAVNEGQPVLEIETDKATQEVPAPASGRLHHVLRVGTRVTEQMIIGYVLAEGEQAPAETVTPQPADPTATIRAASDRDSVQNEEAQSLSGQGRSHNSSAVTDAAWIKASPIARRLASERGI